METSEDNHPKEDSTEDTITFRSVRTESFRTLHASGFALQNDPREGCRLSVFIDRVPLEEAVTFKSDEKGALLQRITKQRESISEFEREVLVEIAVTDREMFALMQDIRNYLQFKGLIRKSEEKKPE
jgi:hypothetical protein